MLKEQTDPLRPDTWVILIKLCSKTKYQLSVFTHLFIFFALTVSAQPTKTLHLNNMPNQGGFLCNYIMPFKVLSVEGTGHVYRRITTHEYIKFWTNQTVQFLLKDG